VAVSIIKKKKKKKKKRSCLYAFGLKVGGRYNNIY